MVESISLLVLGKVIQNKLNKKGIKPFKYIFITIVLWFLFEYLAYMLAAKYLSNFVFIYLLSLPGAAFGGFLGFQIARNAKPTKK
jgi:hypothetical protein